MMEIIEALNLSESSVLLLTAEHESHIYSSTKNLNRVSVKDSTTFSTYDVLRAEKIMVQEGALTKINEVLAR